MSAKRPRWRPATRDAGETDGPPSRDAQKSQRQPHSDPTQVKAPAPKLVKHGTSTNPKAQPARPADDGRSTKPGSKSGESKTRDVKSPDEKSASPKSPDQKSEAPATGRAKGATGRVDQRGRPVGDKIAGDTPPAAPKTAGDVSRADSAGVPTAEIPKVSAGPGRPSSQPPSPAAQSPLVQTSAGGQTSGGGQGRARLKLLHVDPWSVAKVTFALSVAIGVVAVVAMSILWMVLSVTGVWDQINSAVTTVLSDDSGSFDITDYLGFGRLVGLTLVLAAINTVVMTAVAVIGSHLYNLAGQLLGGVNVTFSEED